MTKVLAAHLCPFVEQGEDARVDKAATVTAARFVSSCHIH